MTAGRDEDVKVWDGASGKLQHVYEGHFEEVTGLLVLGRGVVSVGIDATVRQWDLSSDGLGRAVREAEEGRGGVEKEMEMEREEVMKPEVGGLTEEEERELEDLMGDSQWRIESCMGSCCKRENVYSCFICRHSILTQMTNTTST